MKDWYPYYAGFSSDFVASALARHFSAASYVVDPWNGSGTTTAVAARRGLRCAGLDINPAITVVARARLTPVSIRDSIEPVAHEIVRAALREAPPGREAEPLARWLRRPAVETIRRLQHGIHKVLVGDSELEVALAHHPEPSTKSLPLLASFYYSALFAAGRDLLAPFRASNPTWLRYPETHRHRINPPVDLITRLFLQRTRYLADRLTLQSDAHLKNTSVETGSVMRLDGDAVYDACFTSPPYATRVDYVRSTLPELSILGLAQTHVDALRRNTTGTPTVRGTKREVRSLASSLASTTIAQVQTHKSHGSSGYYGPWIRNYLTDLDVSLSCIARAVTKGGTVGIIVQDSYYKAIHIDLQTIVCQTMQELGRELHCREDHRVRHCLVHMNSAARKHLTTRANSESLLVFS